jgi:hypothetical protein
MLVISVLVIENVTTQLTHNISSVFSLLATGFVSVLESLSDLNTTQKQKTLHLLFSKKNFSLHLKNI